MLIRSENAAKSSTQPCAATLRWILEHATVQSALDLGCGKLRYSIALAQVCKRLTLVDSSVQLTRRQRIHADYATILDFARERLPNARVVPLECFAASRGRYDLILCANVLSAIPCPRARAAILRSVRDKLTSRGECLFVTQYTNSYFGKMSQQESSVRHLDGWILTTQRGNFYYGIINKPKLVSLLKRFGYVVSASWVEGQSAFAVGTRP